MKGFRSLLLILFSCLMCANFSFAEEEKVAITIPQFELVTTERKDSPEFLLGKETGPNLKIRSQDNPDLAFQLGVRFMGTAEYSNTRGDDGDFGRGDWDFYARRVRLEVGAQFSKNVKFIMDLRNDRSNQDDRGEGDFNVGDAKVTFKKLFGKKWLNMAIYRAKVDVSRSETVKSGWLINYDRPGVADSAANWVSHNRRATNIQLFGDWNKKVHYQLAVGDGIDGRSFRDATGGRAGGISGQATPMLGGKIRFSPFDGWEEIKRTETYFGEGKHFSVGVGQFFLHGIDLDTGGPAGSVEIDRELTNVELSAHCGGAFIQAEYFYFDGAVADVNADSLEVGNSDGWYVLGEYVMPELGYLSPFARYDSWDRFSDGDGFNQETIVVGVNWFLRGNTTKVGVNYQRDNFETATTEDDSNTIRVTSQFFF